MTTRNQPYNGHKNWTHWNVSLWLNNEEWMYHILMRAAMKAKELNAVCDKRIAIKKASWGLQASLPPKTPDGAKYSLVALQSAIKDAMEEL